MKLVPNLTLAAFLIVFLFNIPHESFLFCLLRIESNFFPLFFPFFSHALFFLLHNIYYKAKVDIDPRPLIYTPNHFI